MKTEKTIDIPATTRTATDFIACDICGVRAKSGDTDNWGGEWCAVDSTVVEMKSGASYHDSGDVTTISYDICPACFKTHLMPMLKCVTSTGPTVTESDW